MSIREVARLNMDKWSAELEKVAAQATDGNQRAAITKQYEDPVFKAILIGTDHEDKQVKNKEAMDIRALINEGAAALHGTNANAGKGNREKAALDRPVQAQEGRETISGPVKQYLDP